MRTLAKCIVLILTLFAGSTMSADTANGLQQFQGKWSGTSGITEIQLDIRPNGQFQWAAKAGDAVGEGDGTIVRKEAAYFIELAFVQKPPLKLKIDKSAQALRLQTDDGSEIVLHHASAS